MTTEPTSMVTEKQIEALAFKFQSIFSDKLSVDADGEIDGAGQASFACARLALASQSTPAPPEVGELVEQLAATRAALETAMGHFGDDMADAFIEFVQTRNGKAAAALSVGWRSIPEGWRLVPIEPTDLMGLGLPEGYKPGSHSATQIWRAMIAAAPLPAQQEQG